MKETFADANFPRSADGRVYHLGIRPGEVANRIVTVGSPSRAEAIAQLLDHGDHHGDVYRPIPAVFRLTSERGFLTITGRFRGVPISIVSIGMGYPNMDFFVREVRECVSGDLVIIRLGSCGGLRDHPVGTLVAPKASVSIRRNYDYDFLAEAASNADGPPYHVSKPVVADPELHAFLATKLKSSPPLDPPAHIAYDTVNASADSFYSSQGRQTSFPDHNESLIDDLVEKIPDIATLEMETFHLLHLASVWRPRTVNLKIGSVPTPAPPTSMPVSPAVTPPPPHAIEHDSNSSLPESNLQNANAPPTPSRSASEVGTPAAFTTPARTSSMLTLTLTPTPTPTPTPRICAAAVQMIFAQRRSQNFITPIRVRALEEWSGRAVLEALTEFHIPQEKLHDEIGSVWETRRIHV